MRRSDPGAGADSFPDPGGLGVLRPGLRLWAQTTPVGTGAELTSQGLWSASKSDLRTEHYVTYTPNATVKPVVFSGTYVASTNTVQSAAAQLEEQGYRVAAAINGGFFNTDGTIVGMLMTDGVVRALDVDNYTLLGFTNDGQVFIDESRPVITAAWTGMEPTTVSVPDPVPDPIPSPEPEPGGDMTSSPDVIPTPDPVFPRSQLPFRNPPPRRSPRPCPRRSRCSSPSPAAFRWRASTPTATPITSEVCTSIIRTSPPG